MSEIVLATINARYAHTAFGLRCLAANLGRWRDHAEILEFTLDDRPADIAEAILARKPRLVGIGVYVWNAEASRELVAILRQVAPELTIVLGGPEVSHEIEDQEIARLAHHVIRGEGEDAFRDLCDDVLERDHATPSRVIDGGLPDLDRLDSPYPLYTDEDLSRRVLYVEASRGCAYRCEFCLSALDRKVRAVPLESFLDDMAKLLDRGARQFKFVDRTFNLDVRRSRAILDFFLERYQPGMFLHFEMVPDRLPTELREPIQRFPAGSLQFEVGIQSLDEQVGERIQRRQDTGRTLDNLRFLREETGVHLHTDLIVGLPGESVDSIADSLNRLVAIDVHEIQIGILKRLRGAPIARHDEAFGMRYSPTPPYEILRTDSIDFALLQRMKRFAQMWNLVVNRGNFRSTARHLMTPTPFHGVLGFTDWVFEELGRVHSIALNRLAELLHRHLVEHKGLPSEDIVTDIREDFTAAGRAAARHLPPFARPAAHRGRKSTGESRIPRRQQRHHGVTSAGRARPDGELAPDS